MIKFVEYDSFDEHGQHIIPVNDLYHMNKVASGTYSPELMKVILNMKRRPDRYYVVINALGSHEVWGCNRNGDSFPESGLTHKSLRTDMGTINDYGFKTFEYYAKLYKHHCFDGDMLVKTSNGFIPIKDISIGDLVYTHTGVQKKVLNIFNRMNDGDFNSLEVAGIDNNIICTDNHRFQVIKKEHLICHYHRKQFKKNNHGNFCCKFKNEKKMWKLCENCNHYKILEPQWIESKNICIGDYVVKSPETINDNDPSTQHTI